MLQNKITTKSPKETKDVAKKLITRIFELKQDKNSSYIICLEGNLGGGKTTFTQGLANGLGIKETVNSPTFLIMKKYSSPELNKKKYQLYHFDCYRLSGYQEILDLGWKEITSEKNNIVVIEWSEKIKEILPKEKTIVRFEFVDKETRKIEIL